MKTLKEFAMIDEIDESLLQHLAITYKENHIYSRHHVILEKYGIYDGCEELASFISKEIRKNHGKELDNRYEFTKDDLKDFANIFFNKIIIDIDTSDDSGAEYFDNDELNKDLLFDEVVINVYLYAHHIKKLKETLMHELTHAYNNYMMLLKGNDHYLKTANSIFYQNIVNTDISNNNEFLLKKALYLLLGYERNAIVAEIKAELEKHKEKVKKPEDALNILKKSKAYKAYKKLDNQINRYFKGELSEKDIKEIEQAYVEITDGEEKNANQIFKKLRSLSKRALKKLDTQLPKMCIENLNNILVTDDTIKNIYLSDLYE